MTLKRLIPLALAGPLIAVTMGCTPSQIRAWQDWHAEDEASAEAFIRNGCGGQCERAESRQDDGGEEESTRSEDDDSDSSGSSSESSGDDSESSGSSGGSSSGYGKWAPIVECESGGDWDYNGGSGYDGGLQFAPSTWDAFGGDQYADFAYQASPAEQIAIAERVLDSQGWGAWPTCSRLAGYR
jgi:hypothetical protein